MIYTFVEGVLAFSLTMAIEEIVVEVEVEDSEILKVSV